MGGTRGEWHGFQVGQVTVRDGGGLRLIAHALEAPIWDGVGSELGWGTEGCGTVNTAWVA